NPKCIPKQEGKTANDALEDPPVEQQRRDCADYKHQGKGPKRKNETRARFQFGKRQGRAAKIAKNEARASVGGPLQGRHAVVEKQKECSSRRKFDEQNGKRDLQQNAAGYDPKGNMPAPSAEAPGHQQKRC